MCIALIGGMKRLEPQYLKEAARAGIELRIFSEPSKNMDEKLLRTDAVIIFTNMVSHNAKRMAKKTAKIHGIPVLMHHACSVCTLRECLNCLNIQIVASHTTLAATAMENKLKRARKNRCNT